MDLSDEEIICLDQSPSKDVVRLNQKSLNIDSGTLYQTIDDVDSDEELYRFFEEPETERKEKRGRHTAEEGRAEKRGKT